MGIKKKFGIHVHLMKKIDRTYAFIEAFQPDTCTIISDIPLYRWIRQHGYVKWPVFRQVWGPSDEQPFHVGNESDIERGFKFAYEGYSQQQNLWWWNRQCGPGSIIQLQNETNSWHMAWWLIGATQAMNREGYGLVGGNMGVGQFADSVINGQLVRALWFDGAGNPRGDIVPGTNQTIWEHFAPYPRYLADNNNPLNFLGWHTYGNEEDGQHRWPDLNKQMGSDYYLERATNFLKMMPKPWPRCMFTEYGSGKTERQKAAGFESTWNGIKTVTAYFNTLEHIVGGSVWTQGDVDGVLGFPGASIDDWILEMIARKGEIPR